MTPDEFYLKTVNKAIDLDGNGIWCWDLWAYFCKLNDIPLYPTIHCSITGYVRDVWYLRHQNGILNYFDEIPVGQFRDGDWVIWGGTKWGDTDYSMTPLSHVGMYYKGKCFNQTKGRGAYLLSLDFNKALGAFRWKGWRTMDQFKYGLNNIRYEDADLTIFKGYDGCGLYMLSAGEGALKDIQEFDNEKLLIVAATNANYFQMRTDQPDRYGTHYGVEQTFDGVDLAPKKEGLLAYFDSINSGIEVAHSSGYWLSRDEVHWACTPYSVVRHRGVSVNLRSTDLGNKEGEKNTQTMICRINDHWFFILSRTAVLPSVMARFAEEYGADEAMLMDSGGSTQLMAWDGQQYKAEVYTGRHIPNVFVIAKEKPAHSEPVDAHDPGEVEEPKPEPVEPVEGGNDEEDDMNDNVTKTILSDRAYDILKWFALICLPGLSVFVLTIGPELIPNYELVAKVISAFAVLLGSLIGVSTVQYNSAKGRSNE